MSTTASRSIPLFARDHGHEGTTFGCAEDSRAPRCAELDLKDVMGEDCPSETFRDFQRNEIARHGEYRTQRIVLATYDDTLVAGGMRPRTEGYR
ncbi:hypothetical protein GCM10009127_08420 [Alteraurantiacibacter aestuarii]|uniref:Uncharacterized protein n=1 Tax=Alteraurantiacibacter aestuarii TaxID=650004 RepID=A0A844ZIG6_9SPHN|nr:hypothetical protein [Alteraurantiacibacter aestuarii]MXO87233.1 hypothetical protein [Alteraurantiacibacter aestuarii]